MTDHNTSGVSRRSIAKGAAWAAPVIAVAATAPFAAASHHVPPPPEEVAGTSCKTGGNDGTIKKGFYGQFTVANYTGSTLTYTITSFLPPGSTTSLEPIQVSQNPSDEAWTGASNTFIVPTGTTTTFWIRGSGLNSGNGVYKMFYTVSGFGGTFSSDLEYASMPVCCESTANPCPPYADDNVAAPTTSSAPVESKTSAAPTTEAAPSSATEQAAPTSEAAAPVTETQTAKVTESAVATEAPASSSN